MTEEPFRPQKAIILSELSTIDNEVYYSFLYDDDHTADGWTK
jgi:hypothetical protein